MGLMAIFRLFAGFPLLLTHFKMDQRIKTGSLSINKAKGVNRHVEAPALMAVSLFPFYPRVL